MIANFEMEQQLEPGYKHGPSDFAIERLAALSIPVTDGVTTTSLYSLSIAQSTEHVLHLGNPVSSPEPPPNGGLVAWTQVLMGHLLVFNGSGYVSSFGLFQAYYETTLGRPASDIS